MRKACGSGTWGPCPIFPCQCEYLGFHITTSVLGHDSLCKFADEMDFLLNKSQHNLKQLFVFSCRNSFLEAVFSPSSEKFTLVKTVKSCEIILLLEKSIFLQTRKLRLILMVFR